MQAPTENTMQQGYGYAHSLLGSDYQEQLCCNVITK